MSFVISDQAVEIETSPFGVGRLRLENFRNYERAEVDLDPGFNLFSGENGQGKTNLLEALYLVATSKLLRGSRDSEAIREGSSRAFAEVEFATTGSTMTLVLAAGVRKRAMLNGASLPRASDVLGRLPCVCFSSADLPVVAGQPADRRLFLDLVLSQLYPAYMRSLTVYRRALDQRNALLKQAQERPQPESLFQAWEAELAEHGSALREFRSRLIGQLEPLASEYQERLGSGERLNVVMEPCDASEDAQSLLERLEQTRALDIGRGATQVGPHRDEMSIRVDGREARFYGSQGQQRTAIIALKLAVLAVTTECHRAPPLLLLDDIFSDLDKNRRKRLIDIVTSSAGQVVVTCTEREQAGEEIVGRARSFKVSKGTVSPL